MDAVRACLSAVIGAVLIGAVLVLTGQADSAVTAVVPLADPVPQAPLVAGPPPEVRVSAAPAPTSSTTARPTTTRRTTTTTTTTSADAATDEPDDRCTNQIDYASDPRSNAEINSIGEQTGRCPRPLTASELANPGELALEACVEQTGMTREECIADAAAGNAN
ncbi:hypothetical protein [Actinomycetospora aeridis]|uniref:Secreted protein n=1 Tax=Actinomycetospora aeridis TaxID=3129231 RepID=A0ABU8N1M9_9PSEU